MQFETEEEGKTKKGKRLRFLHISTEREYFFFFLVTLRIFRKKDGSELLPFFPFQTEFCGMGCFCLVAGISVISSFCLF